MVTKSKTGWVGKALSWGEAAVLSPMYLSRSRKTTHEDGKTVLTPSGPLQSYIRESISTISTDHVL